MDIKNANLLYKGKSKDIYALPNGNILMVFGDGFTGTNGVEDPGGNKNIGTKAGLGRKNLEVSSYLFDKIMMETSLPTHQVCVDIQNNMIEAKHVKTLGKGMIINGITAEGLEFISRNKAWGSYLKRNPSVKQGDSLLTGGCYPFVEVSVKNDEAGDPFFTREEYIQSGIFGTDYDLSIMYTKMITKYLTDLFSSRGMELIDMKMEFGKDDKDKVILSDEISPGSLRALINGNVA